MKWRRKALTHVLSSDLKEMKKQDAQRAYYPDVNKNLRFVAQVKDQHSIWTLVV
jgi:hypothetical protein